jgi:hypothetical protein
MNDIFKRTEDLIIDTVDVVFESNEVYLPITLKNATILKNQQLISFIDENNQINLPVDGVLALARFAAH